MLTLLSFNLRKFVTADRVCFTHREGGREWKKSQGESEVHIPA